ncbi:MAG: aminotransferase class V-fold PLP-dependent enzyme, partial [Christensenellales bacterium]
MSERVYNFAAGPAVMPEEVLQKAASELVCYQDTGMSVMEMSHRGAAFSKILHRRVTCVPWLISDNYKVLFLQGGASLQFSMIPMNLMRKSFKADYINTGAWSKKAIKEAKKVGKVNVVASSEEDNFTHIPEIDPAKFDKEADYLYIVTNNTIYG